MPKPLAIFIACAVALLAPSLALAQSTASKSAIQLLNEQQQTVGTKAFTASNYKPGIIKHIVLFKYKKSVTSAQIAEVRHRFLALKSEATKSGKPYIIRIEAGAQNSGEGADKGFQEGFIVTFRSEGDRNYYVGTPVVIDSKFYDPAHQKFKDFVGPLLAEQDGALVFDFKAETK